MPMRKKKITTEGIEKNGESKSTNGRDKWVKRKVQEKKIKIVKKNMKEEK